MMVTLSRVSIPLGSSICIENVCLWPAIRYPSSVFKEYPEAGMLVGSSVATITEAQEFDAPAAPPVPPS